MKTRIIITIAAVLFTMVSTAQVRGNGKVTSEKRNVDSFSSIKLTSSADIYISQGQESVVVKTDENVQEYIKTEVEDGTLYIGAKGRGFRSVEKLEVHISVPTLEKLVNSGSGDIYIDNGFKVNGLFISITGSGDLEAELNAVDLELKVVGSGDCDISGITGTLKVTVSGSGDIEANELRLEDCYVKNTGSGDISLQGKTNNLVVNQAGSGDLDAYHLTTVGATITNSGSSDISIHVIERLQVTLNGSGDLTFKGDPATVDVRTNGSGDVYRR